MESGSRLPTIVTYTTSLDRGAEDEHDEIERQKKALAGYRTQQGRPTRSGKRCARCYKRLASSDTVAIAISNSTAPP